jgi:hypothetical protein
MILGGHDPTPALSALGRPAAIRTAASLGQPAPTPPTGVDLSEQGCDWCPPR